jgi:3-deoxy-D-manno-octulosonate 8-phosphate phosphatase (KDO 8-P phosphatase)
MERSTMRDNLIMEKKARQVKFLLVDCDGVLTDGTFFCLENGEDMKKFSFSDLLGAKRLRELAGIEIGLINDEESPSYIRLAAKMNIKELYLGVEQKELVLEQLRAKLSLNLDQIAYIGNEVNDVELMKCVGLSACPLDAAYEARGAADYVCNSCGGSGVLREFAEFLILARQKEKCLIDVD